MLTNAIYASAYNIWSIINHNFQMHIFNPGCQIGLYQMNRVNLKWMFASFWLNYRVSCSEEFYKCAFELTINTLNTKWAYLWSSFYPDPSPRSVELRWPQWAPRNPEPSSRCAPPRVSTPPPRALAETSSETAGHNNSVMFHSYLSLSNQLLMGSSLYFTDFSDDLNVPKQDVA